MKKLLQTLTETLSPSGYEEEVREIVRREVTPLADDVRVDALGNLIARKGPGKAVKDVRKIMVAAPMDEPGAMVSHVDRNGFVRFSLIGQVSRRDLPGSRVRFSNGTQGVVGASFPDNENEVPPLEKMYIDVGASNPEECPVQVGEVAVFDGPFQEMGNRLTGKSIGSRAGVLIAIETLRSLKAAPHEVSFVFTAQAGVGARGAMTAAYRVDPDVAIALGVAPAADAPGSHNPGIALGSGPCLRIQEAGMIADPRLVQWMTGAAQKNRIACQSEILTKGESDGRRIQTTRAGVPSACLSVPARYVHSPSEMVDLSDVQNAIKLLNAALRAPIGL